MKKKMQLEKPAVAFSFDFYKGILLALLKKSKFAMVTASSHITFIPNTGIYRG